VTAGCRLGSTAIHRESNHQELKEMQPPEHLQVQRGSTSRAYIEHRHLALTSVASRPLSEHVCSREMGRVSTPRHCGSNEDRSAKAGRKLQKGVREQTKQTGPERSYYQVQHAAPGQHSDHTIADTEMAVTTTNTSSTLCTALRVRALAVNVEHSQSKVVRERSQQVG
jgi:hypothetical protein